MLKFGCQAVFSLKTHFIAIPRPIRLNLVGAQSLEVHLATGRNSFYS